MTEFRLHPRDEMTPIERREALEKGSPFDRLPCTLSLGEVKAPLYGADYVDLVTSAEIMTEAEIHAFNLFGADSVSMGANSYGIAEAMGACVRYPKNKLPYIEEPYLADYGLLDEMEVVDPLRDGRIPLYLEVCGRLAEKAAGMVEVTSSVGGPFTIASYLRGTENLMKDLYKEPENALRLLRLVTDCIKRCIDVFAPLGVRFAMADPVASGNMISPRAFHQVVFPYLQEIAAYAEERSGKKPTFHLCGRTEKLWDDISRLPIDSFSLDERVDLSHACQRLGKTLKLAGNVSPVEVLLNGTREEIFSAVKACVKQGASNPMGYILAPGCQVSPQTPAENIGLYMEAARTYGAYEYVRQIL